MLFICTSRLVCRGLNLLSRVVVILMVRAHSVSLDEFLLRAGSSLLLMCDPEHAAATCCGCRSWLDVNWLLIVRSRFEEWASLCRVPLSNHESWLWLLRNVSQRSRQGQWRQVYLINARPCCRGTQGVVRLLSHVNRMVWRQASVLISQIATMLHHYGLRRLEIEALALKQTCICLTDRASCNYHALLATRDCIRCIRTCLSSLGQHALLRWGPILHLRMHSDLLCWGMGWHPANSTLLRPNHTYLAGGSNGSIRTSFNPVILLLRL